MVNVGLNSDMDIQDIRRKNLRRILDTQFGGVMSRLADAVGRQPSYISRMLADEGKAGRKGFGEDLARIFEESLGLSRGALDQDDAHARDTATQTDVNVSPGPNIRGMLPLISWVQAGSFCDVIDCLQPGDAEAWYPCPVTHTPNAYVLRVDGDSMFPEYRDGEMIFVDPRGGYVHGDDVIVRDPDGKATFKRLQITPDGTFLLAINPAWPDRIIRIPDNSQICGKVIFQGRPR